VGVELAAIIPFAIVIGGAGLALAAIADTTGLITEIVMD